MSGRSRCTIIPLCQVTVHSLHLTAEVNHQIWREKPSERHVGGDRNARRGRHHGPVWSPNTIPAAKQTTSDYHLVGESLAHARLPEGRHRLNWSTLIHTCTCKHITFTYIISLLIFRMHNCQKVERFLGNFHGNLIWDRSYSILLASALK